MLYVPEKSPYIAHPEIRAYLEREFRAISRVFNAQSPELYQISEAERDAGVDVDESIPYGNILRFHCPTDGSSDCAPAHNAALSCVPYDRVNGARIYYPAIGTSYRFLTVPNDITTRCLIEGDSMAGTQLLRDYDCPSSDIGIFNVRGAGAALGDGVRIENFKMIAGNGRSGGCYVSSVASAGYAVSMLRCKNLNLSAEPGGTSDYDIYIDGSANPADPLGVRATVIETCELFGGTLGAVFAKSTMGLRGVGSNTYDAGGVPGTHGTVFITGDATTHSFYPRWDGAIVHGFNLDYCERVLLSVSEISGDVVNTANVSMALVLGHCSGTVQSNWVDSTHLPP